MPELIEQKVSVGRDRYGREVVLTRSKEGGQYFWAIRQTAGSQRDECYPILGLTDENIREMAKCLEVIRG